MTKIVYKTAPARIGQEVSIPRGTTSTSQANGHIPTPFYRRVIVTLLMKRTGSSHWGRVRACGETSKPASTAILHTRTSRISDVSHATTDTLELQRTGNSFAPCNPAHKTAGST